MASESNTLPIMVDDVACLRDYATYPRHVIEDVVRLRRRIED